MDASFFSDDNHDLQGVNVISLGVRSGKTNKKKRNKKKKGGEFSIIP